MSKWINKPPSSPSPASVTSGRPGSIYSALAGSLISDIQSGRYAVGDRLPTEATLRQMFDVSRHTVRQALQELKAQGFISTQQGIGTTVRARHNAFRFVHSGSTMDDLVQFSHATQTSVIDRREIIADERYAELLHCPVGQLWLELSALRYALGQSQAIGHLWIYLRPEFAGVIPLLESTTDPHFTLIERTYGIKLAEMEQEIASVILPDGIADRLEAPRGGHGLRITRRFRDQQDRLTQVSIGIYPSERLTHTTKVRVRRGEGD